MGKGQCKYVLRAYNRKSTISSSYFQFNSSEHSYPEGTFFDLLLCKITYNPLVGFGIQEGELHTFDFLPLPATNKAGVIAGAVIGALLLLLLLLLLIWLLICCCHKRRYQKEVANEIRYFMAV